LGSYLFSGERRSLFFPEGKRVRPRSPCWCPYLAWSPPAPGPNNQTYEPDRRLHFPLPEAYKAALPFTAQRSGGLLFFFVRGAVLPLSLPRKQMKSSPLAFPFFLPREATTQRILSSSLALQDKDPFSLHNVFCILVLPLFFFDGVGGLSSICIFFSPLLVGDNGNLFFLSRWTICR